MDTASAPHQQCGNGKRGYVRPRQRKKSKPKLHESGYDRATWRTHSKAEIDLIDVLKQIGIESYYELLEMASMLLWEGTADVPAGLIWEKTLWKE